ncbi:MAG: hypothetical protein JSR30_00160 [Proteobacteria bacterium]|nr:hypothetical protein [Pseudomonadota bacterium]
MTTERKFEPTEQTKRIISLMQEVSAAVDEVRRNQKHTVAVASKCGALLNAEQQKVTKEFGRGRWMNYYEIHFAKYVPYSTGRRWMTLAIANGVKSTQFLSERLRSDDEEAVSKAESPDSADEKEDCEADDTPPNNLRRGLLALELMPKKVEQQVIGNRPTPRLTSHLAIINRFKAWLADFKRSMGHRKLTEAQREQLSQDFREVIAFCKELEGV